MELEGIEVEEIRQIDEIDLVSRLRGSEKQKVRELIRAIENRRLYKRVVWSGERLEPELLDKLRKGLEEEFGHLALLDYPEMPKFEERNAFVERNGEVKRLSEVSPLVRALVEAKESHWRWGIYARADVVERVREFVSKNLK